MLKLSFLGVNSKVAESLNYLGKKFVLSVMPLAAHPQLAPGGIHIGNVKADTVPWGAARSDHDLISRAA